MYKYDRRRGIRIFTAAALAMAAATPAVAQAGAGDSFTAGSAASAPVAGREGLPAALRVPSGLAVGAPGLRAGPLAGASAPTTPEPAVSPTRALAAPAASASAPTDRGDRLSRWLMVGGGALLTAALVDYVGDGTSFGLSTAGAAAYGTGVTLFGVGAWRASRTSPERPTVLAAPSGRR